MQISYTQSRAAILCFGGWGMQAMFHLLPRLQAAQEQRAALGAIGPDLESITRFGAVVPEPLLDESDMAQLHLLQPDSQIELPPFYIERTLARLDEERETPDSLTASERRCAALLKATTPHLNVLDFDDSGFRAPGKGIVLDRKQKVRHATRADLFNTSLIHADRLARLLEMHMLDPIRHDLLDPDDPFVQTTLYVVAPFFEPLATAPIWPIITQLMNRAGRRHISQVVGIFATGSYAPDISRALEDGATYAALRELELLAGLRTQGNSRDIRAHPLAQRVAESGSPLAAQIGDEIFDFVYLLDREKSNQSLTDDSHELAIQAGNALEAMIVAGGNLFIQEQLGLGIHHGEKRPYSLIGAASDYVPVSQILHAVNRQEESRLVRDWVLRSTPAPSANPLQRRSAVSAPKSLDEFGFTTERALAQLVVRHPDLYANRKPRTIEDLRVPRTYILPDMVDKAMRRLSGSRWPATFSAHLAELSGHLGLAAGPSAIDEAWGLDVGLARASLEQSLDDRIYPQTVRRIQSHLSELVVASPSGLSAAERQVDLWKNEVEQERLWLLTRSTPSSRKLLDIRQEQAHRDWSANYARVANRTPSLAATMLRAGIAIAVVTALAMAYLWIVGGTWSWADDGIALAGFATGILTAAMAAFIFRSNRIQRLREERVALAQDEFTNLLQRTATDGLVRLVDGILVPLNDWAQMLAEARQELHVLSTPPSMPAVPPPDVPLDYLYTPHMNEALWARGLSYLREQIDAEGLRSEDRLDHLWGQPEWRRSMLRMLRSLPGGARIGSASGPNRRATAIAQFIRDTVRESVAPVSLERYQPGRADLIVEFANQYSVEHMLWRYAADANDLQKRLRALNGDTRHAAHPEIRVAPEMRPEARETTKVFPVRRYVETAWNRAKPTANYDVSDRLAVYGITVDFVAAGGAQDSDLARVLRDEFKFPLLPTQDPFSVTVVRTVHGLALDDLDCMQRYRAELTYLLPQERALIKLVDDPEDVVYRAGRSRSARTNVTGELP